MPFWPKQSTARGWRAGKLRCKLRARLWDATASARLRHWPAPTCCSGRVATRACCSAGTGEPHDLLQGVTAAAAAPAIVISTFGEHGAAGLVGDSFIRQPALPVQMIPHW
ncbi:MAG: hypothetical protein U0074_10825 [Kouleothrix sp.]